jgi:hypothetical protein
MKGKRAPCYISSFVVLAKLEPTDVVVDDVVPLDANLPYLEHPVKLLGQQDRVMR